MVECVKHLCITISSKFVGTTKSIRLFLGEDWCSFFRSVKQESGLCQTFVGVVDLQSHSLCQEMVDTDSIVRDEEQNIV